MAAFSSRLGLAKRVTDVTLTPLSISARKDPFRARARGLLPAPSSRLLNNLPIG